jgi:hypothetical protein
MKRKKRKRKKKRRRKRMKSYNFVYLQSAVDRILYHCMQ